MCNNLGFNPLPVSFQEGKILIFLLHQRPYYVQFGVTPSSHIGIAEKSCTNLLHTSSVSLQLHISSKLCQLCFPLNDFSLGKCVIPPTILAGGLGLLK
jgi:hypothetical protein